MASGKVDQTRLLKISGLRGEAMTLARMITHLRCSAGGLQTRFEAARAGDLCYKPYENEGAVEQEMRDYLTWEIALVEQIERDGDAGFVVFD